jgi:trk system potassium uptake protein TrkA
MQVIIAGGGSVGRFIAEQLSANGNSVTIIDNERANVERYTKRNEPAGVKWILGDACDIGVLGNAGLANAEVVAAVTGDDEDNLVVSLLAKQEFGVPRVVARVNNPKNDWLFNETWGIDVSVSTPHLLTALVQEAVTVGSFVSLMSLKGGSARLAEVTLDPASPAVDKTISEVRLPHTAAIVAVVRGSHVVTPTPETILRGGDEVMLLLSDDCEADIRSALCAPTA